MSSAAALGWAPALATSTHVRRTQSCETCGATGIRVTYERTIASVENSLEWLISASCTNEACERFDRRTKRREYANEAVARPAAAGS
jgi:hypothetical protein